MPHHKTVTISVTSQQATSGIIVPGEVLEALELDLSADQIRDAIQQRVKDYLLRRYMSLKSRAADAHANEYVAQIVKVD